MQILSKHHEASGMTFCATKVVLEAGDSMIFYFSKTPWALRFSRTYNSAVPDEVKELINKDFNES